MPVHQLTLLYATMIIASLIMLYTQYLTHFVQVPQLMEEFSLQCSQFEKLPDQISIPYDASSWVQGTLWRYGDTLKSSNRWLGTTFFPKGYSGYKDIDYDLPMAMAFDNAVESIHKKYYIGEGSTTVVYGIPGCDKWVMKYRLVAEHQKPRQNQEEINWFLQQKGIVPKTRCFQNIENKDVAQMGEGDICVQQRAMSLKNYWSMNPDKHQELIKALMVYYSRKDRYNVMYEGYDSDQLGVFNDPSNSNLKCGTTLSVRLLDTDGATIGDWRQDCENWPQHCEAADFVYYPQNVRDTYGDVGRILGRITGESAKGYGIRMKLNGAGEWELQKYNRA